MALLIALGSGAAGDTPLAMAGKRDYVRPGIFIQSSASGLKKSTDPQSGGEYLPAKLESTPDPVPLAGDSTPYPDLPEVEHEGTIYRMTQAAATAWSIQLANRMTAQASSEGWHIQDDFEWRGPLRRLAGQWIGDGSGAIPAEEDSAAYDAMFAAWTRGKQHVANVDYPNSPYGSYALGWPRPFLNPTGLGQRRGAPTADEISWIKTHFWDPQNTHYVHGHFKPMADAVLSSPDKFREAYRIWCSSEKARLAQDGPPESQWTISIWLPFFGGDHENELDPALGIDFLRSALEGIAEAQWPSVDMGGIENVDHVAMGFASRAAFVERVLEIADETVFVDGQPGPSSTFQPSQPIAGQPLPTTPGSPVPLKDHQAAQRVQIAGTIMQRGVPAKYYRRGEGPGVCLLYTSGSRLAA